MRPFKNLRVHLRQKSKSHPQGNPQPKEYNSILPLCEVCRTVDLVELRLGNLRPKKILHKNLGELRVSAEKCSSCKVFLGVVGRSFCGKEENCETGELWITPPADFVPSDYFLECEKARLGKLGIFGEEGELCLSNNA
jgi:hypothetical protein